MSQHTCTHTHSRVAAALVLLSFALCLTDCSCLFSLQCCSPHYNCCIVCGHVSALALIVVYNVQQVQIEKKLYVHPGACLLGLSSFARVPCSTCEPACAAAVTKHVSSASCKKHNYRELAPGCCLRRLRYDR